MTPGQGDNCARTMEGEIVALRWGVYVEPRVFCGAGKGAALIWDKRYEDCLLYTSDAADE